MLSIYSKLESGWSKFVLGVICAGLAFSVYLHLMPGFNNYKIADQICLSLGASPYTMYANIDKAMVGLILLLYYRSLNQSIKGWLVSVKFIPVPLIIACLLLIGSAYAMNYIKFDPKMPSILWFWIPINLMFVCVAEEVFCRGFIQQEFSKLFAAYPYGHYISILLAALIFGAAHYSGGIAFVILSTLAGITYGYAFLKSKHLEAPILIHFLVNLIHIVFFSYPSVSR